jgi:hypothetical protein
MAKQSMNLSLDPEAVSRGQRYSELHGTSVSQLVNRFLSSLPLEDESEFHLPPVVSRLVGIVSDKDAVKHYREHLAEKYGR